MKKKSFDIAETVYTTFTEELHEKLKNSEYSSIYEYDTINPRTGTIAIYHKSGWSTLGSTPSFFGKTVTNEELLKMLGMNAEPAYQIY